MKLSGVGLCAIAAAVPTHKPTASPATGGSSDDHDFDDFIDAEIYWSSIAAALVLFSMVGAAFCYFCHQKAEPANDEGGAVEATPSTSRTLATPLV